MNFAKYTTARGHEITTQATHVGLCVSTTGKDTTLAEIIATCNLSALTIWTEHDGRMYLNELCEGSAFVRDGRQVRPTPGLDPVCYSIDGCWMLLYLGGDRDQRDTLSVCLDVVEFNGRMWLGATAYDSDNNRIQGAVNVEFD